MVAYRNFICYRGGKSPGKSIADRLFMVLDSRREEFGATYFSIRGEVGDPTRNYLQDIEFLQTVKNVILVLTDDYFDDFLTDDLEPNTNSVALMEFETIVQARRQGIPIEIVPLFCDGFSWSNENKVFGCAHKEVIELIWDDKTRHDSPIFTAAAGNGRAFERESRVPDASGEIPEGVVEYIADTIRVGFPVSYVRQGPHIVYFPTLLDVTPFDYTFIALSDRGSNCASELNYARAHNGRYWVESDWRSFLNGDYAGFDNNEAMIVSVPVSDSGRISDIIDCRKANMPGVPMIINVFGSSGVASKKAIPESVVGEGRVATVLEQVNEIQQIAPLSEREIKALYDRDPTECWRRMLGDRSYRELANDIFLNSSLGDRYMLATEETRESFDCYRAEKMMILGDVVMREERYSNKEFIAKVYDWERGSS